MSESLFHPLILRSSSSSLMLACTSLHSCKWWHIVFSAGCDSTLGIGHKWGPGGNGLFAGGLPLCLHSCPSFPHHRQKDRPPHHLRALGEWIPLKPMILGDSVGGTTQKKWMSFGELFAMWWVTWRSFQPVHASWTSWTSEPMRPA